MATIADAVQSGDANLLASLLRRYVAQAETTSSDASCKRVDCARAALALSACTSDGQVAEAAQALSREFLHERYFGDKGDNAERLSLCRETYDAMLDELCSMWNDCVPDELRCRSKSDLPHAVQKAKDDTLLFEQFASQGRAAMHHSRNCALDMLVDALSASLKTLEIDCAERGSPNAATDAAAAKVIARANAIEGKLYMLRAQLASEMYTEQSVRNLKMHAGMLHAKIAKLTKERDDLKRNLRRYQQLCENENFGDIVAEYTSLKARLEEKRWSLRELGA